MSVPNQPVVVANAASTWPCRKLALAATFGLLRRAEAVPEAVRRVELEVGRVAEAVAHDGVPVSPASRPSTAIRPRISPPVRNEGSLPQPRSRE